MKDKYLRETRMVDFSNPAIQKLIQNMKWKEMGEFERIKAIYNYVRAVSYTHLYLAGRLPWRNCFCCDYGDGFRCTG